MPSDILLTPDYCPQHESRRTDSFQDTDNENTLKVHPKWEPERNFRQGKGHMKDLQY